MEHIETTDLFRSAFLMCRGGQLQETKHEGSQIIFVIVGEGMEHEDVQFRIGQASVNPLLLRETVNYLRDLVYEHRERRQHGNATQRGNSTNQGKHRSGATR